MARPRKSILRTQNSEYIASEILNDLTFEYYLRTFKKLCLSMFDWDLPDSMDSRWLEEVLYYNGISSLLFDDNYGYINTPCSFSGNFNIYGLATRIHCYSYGYHANRMLYTGYKDELLPATDNKQCVLVFNCQDKEPTFSSMELFAYRMYLADRCCDINLNSMKNPMIILTDEKTKLSMENAYLKYDGNQPVIVAKKGQFNPDDFTHLNGNVEFVADRVQDLKKEIWNELLTFLGINNLNEKKERMVADETNQNNELINLNLQSFLVPRQKAVKQFNELFNQNIKVRVRSDLINYIKNTESIVFNGNFNKEEGVENE